MQDILTPSLPAVHAAHLIVLCALLGLEMLFIFYQVVSGISPEKMDVQG